MEEEYTNNPNSPGYTNALLEDMNNKFQVILEATQVIPKIQQDVEGLKQDLEDVKEIVTDMQPKVDATFEEVGTLRLEVNEIKNNLSPIHSKKLAL